MKIRPRLNIPLLVRKLFVTKLMRNSTRKLVNVFVRMKIRNGTIMLENVYQTVTPKKNSGSEEINVSPNVTAQPD